jgi:lincosamide nucleotidyltransferase A/C/D/E
MTPISRLRQFVGRCLGRSSAAERFLRNLDFPAADVPRVHRWLAAEGIQAWITGGWGVDAIAGEQTRPHLDLDLLVPIDQGDQARTILEEHGFELYPPEIRLPFRLAMVNRRARRMIDLQLASPNPDGTYTFRVIDTQPSVPNFDYVYSAEGLGGRGRVAGVELPCVSREEQVRSRTTLGYSFESPQRMREGGILADVHDLEVMDGLQDP